VTKFYRKILPVFENWLGILSLLILIIIPIFEIFFNISGSNQVLESGVLILTFVSGIVATRKGSHLVIGGGIRFTSIKSFQKNLLNFGAAIILTLLIISSLSFSFIANAGIYIMNVIPLWLVSLVIPLSFFSSLMVLNRKTHPGNRWYILLGIVIGLFLSWRTIENFLDLTIGLPEFLYEPSYVIEGINRFLKWPLMVFFLVLAFFGLPIYLSLAGIAASLFLGDFFSLDILPDEAFKFVTNDNIPAIPIFTLVGFLLSESQSGKRLVRLFSALIGFVPGGVAIVAVAVSALFTTFTGASGITILALGALLMSLMTDKNRYTKNFSSGFLTASGSIGLLFPPSLAIILFGSISQTSILDLFIGGAVPGLLLVTAMAIVGYLFRNKNQTEQFKAKVYGKEVFEAFKDAAFDLMIPILIYIALIYTTVLQAAGVGVAASVIVLTLIKREVKLSEIPYIFRKSLPVLGGILMILAAATGLQSYLIFDQVPMNLADWMINTIESKVVFLLLLNLGLLITGCIMDLYSATLVVVPLILPLAADYGIHPVHLGILFIANLELGFLTPPVGLNLFLSSYRFGLPLKTIYRQVIPFFLVQLVIVEIITFWPDLSLFLLGK
jgi:C4-dicarboxylate transporter DctM subunit